MGLTTASIGYDDIFMRMAGEYLSTLQIHCTYNYTNLVGQHKCSCVWISQSASAYIATMGKLTSTYLDSTIILYDLFIYVIYIN